MTIGKEIEYIVSERIYFAELDRFECLAPIQYVGPLYWPA